MSQFFAENLVPEEQSICADKLHSLSVVRGNGEFLSSIIGNVTILGSQRRND
jgi:hypothetical protein